MEKKKRLLKTKMATAILAVALLLQGCSAGTTQPGSTPSNSAGSPPAQTSDYRFDFAGTEQFDDGQQYSIHIRADKDSADAFALVIDELPQFQLSGRYTFVDGKGYKLYFDDIDSQFVYTAYDTNSQDFSFKYKLDLGEALGNRRISFNFHDEAFASSYDGEGLGMTPPTFEGSGWGGYLGQFEIAPAKLTCYEDGTASFTATAVTAVDPKNGTWEYDGDTNTYHFSFPPQTFANSQQIEEHEDGSIGYKIIYGESDVRFDRDTDTTPTDFYTTYDEATGTYNLELEIVWYVYSIIYMSYTA